MLSYLKTHRRLIALSCVLAIVWFFMLSNHPYSSLISFDEGFHGGSVIWEMELIKKFLAGESLGSVEYIRREFNNGAIYYPPLWNVVAMIFGILFGASTAVFRSATVFISLLTLVAAYWLARRDSDQKTSLAAATILATIPMFFVYSHLMMLEVPFAFGLILALAAYYWYLDTSCTSSRQLVIVCLAFMIGVHGKVLDVALIVGTIVIYGLGLLLLDRRSQHAKKLFSWPTLLFIVAGLLSWYGYIWAVEHYLKADMLGFYFGQSSNQSGQGNSAATQLLVNITKRYDFYLRDFLNYPWLSLVWLTCTVYCLVWLRKRLYYFLAAMCLATWLLFSGIFPQVPQYIMPIYIALAVYVSAVFYELSLQLSKRGYDRSIILVGLTVTMTFWQLLTLPASDSYGWRTIRTYQQNAADYVASQANHEDIIFVPTDSVAYSIRLAGLGKQVVTYNLGHNSEEINSNARWAVVVINDATKTEMLDKMDPNRWQLVQSFGDSSGGTDVYFNPLN